MQQQAILGRSMEGKKTRPINDYQLKFFIGQYPEQSIYLRNETSLTVKTNHKEYLTHYEAIFVTDRWNRCMDCEMYV